MISGLDRFDLLILAALQVDTRQSLAEIAAQVGLSPSPTWRRIKAMEDAGVIEGQVAIVNPRALGLLAVAYVCVWLNDHSEPSHARFTAFVQADPRIVDCATVTGEGDYMLKVMSKDPEDLDTFLMHRLMATGLVRSTTIQVVLRSVKRTTVLPLSYEG
ncbi:MAG: Lrp/AsnC family transcriptional regulator [Rhodobacteraceae bacterium]|nr:Lrp/AsnC family transcriptional regulator [Paracoccaceae bacterium]MCF8514764.1 Lrp/AsnC family transcriptional regulator [Paracoccaceae bacterium]MCF8519008.1 Lrp/AsnC family transcriptional regulator [Paracoccaceae bacterium]